MSTRKHYFFEAALLIAIAAAATPAFAADPVAGPSEIVIDCANPALPSQREVGELLGQDNFSQIYNSRRTLMAEAHQACQRDGVRQARLTRAKPARPARETPPVAYDFGNR